MADLSYTANTVLWVSGPTDRRNAAETIAEGDWVYEVSATTVGVATNDNASKDTVIGMALNGGVAGKPITYATNGAVVAATATPAIAVGSWYVLSASGATSPVADQTSNDYVSGVAYGSAAGQLTVDITNTGVQVP